MGVKYPVRYKKGERGATILLITRISTFVLVPIVGLAIDGSVLFWMNARLSAAVDAAALAGGRSLNVGVSQVAQELNATTIAQQYFSANFPDGFMRSSIVGPTVMFTYPSTHLRTVQVTASAVVPLYFMPILHVSTATIGAVGTASRRDANILLVLDRSESMNNSSGACAALVASAQSFVSHFANGRDRLGLVTFSSLASLDFKPSYTFNTDSPSLPTTLAKLKCMGYTSTAEGLNLAYTTIQGLSNATGGALNVILLFTDGSPSSITAAFPIKRQADTRYGTGNGTRGTTSYTNPNTATSASSCTPSSLLSVTGLLIDGSGETASTVAGMNATGQTGGLYQVGGTWPLTASTLLPPLVSQSGCSFSSDQTMARVDVANIPETDRNGYSTAGGSIPGVPAVDRFTSGPYNALIRPDMPRTVRWVAFNAADAIAQAVHNDTNFSPVIYTIGLAGNESMAMNQAFMERLANDPRANNYDQNKPVGQFILATDNASVAAAFNQIASQVLRLAK
jgi:Flp pilus assembly protein TadG